MPEPARQIAKLARAKILKMGIDLSGATTLVLYLPQTDRECRNALHRAMKKGEDVALGYRDADVPDYEGESL